MNIYMEFMWNQIEELLEMFPQVAGIWLDGLGTPLSGDYSVFKCQELYDMIHSKQPHVLVSYKQGLLGTEDFLAPERNWKGITEKPMEICETMQPRGWGYMLEDEGKHKSKEDIIKMLKNANNFPANLLLNTGPLPSGEIHPDDVNAFRAVGKEIREKSWDGILNG